MIYNINGEAYLCSVTTNEIGILDLFYYTIVTFTTIGYGDIVPNAPESKVMAIIIAFTSVICLIIFISSILSAKSNFKKKLK
ncbi:potassium channel family protein [Clostridium weizhouense]|uniref:Potassium channel family protein n=1 Tax=Clostridium weizhouense TaxID=2859781 RepID=A0ABS7AQS5_9CLOT|nr:potassium channel family protein [Clostridium weizhouense]MBW6411008.1 potassium channel family protein [Clostridium weizhouense]